MKGFGTGSCEAIPDRGTRMRDTGGMATTRPQIHASFLLALLLATTLGDATQSRKYVLNINAYSFDANERQPHRSAYAKDGCGFLSQKFQHHHDLSATAGCVSSCKATCSTRSADCRLRMLVRFCNRRFILSSSCREDADGGMVSTAVLEMTCVPRSSLTDQRTTVARTGPAMSWPVIQRIQHDHRRWRSN